MRTALDRLNNRELEYLDNMLSCWLDGDDPDQDLETGWDLLIRIKEARMRRHGWITEDYADQARERKKIALEEMDHV